MVWPLSFLHFFEKVLDSRAWLVYYVAIMYVDSCTTNTKSGTYTRHLIRENYREGGKVKHRNIANISRCSGEEVAAIRLALRHKGNLAALGSIPESVEVEQGRPIGAVWLVYDVARRLGIAKALGNSRQGKLAFWQVIARVLEQGSRLSAVRLADRHGACDILGLEAFNEDDLYRNLDWLCENQAKIEDRLFRALHPSGPPQLYLYDVTSTYLEGTKNELGEFGYNRDGKKGKRQIVIGLLCNEEGKALSIEAFRGNMGDPKTVASQVKKVAERFGGSEVTFVGDRGMLKSQQVDDLTENGFHYITAITKSQIGKLLRQGTIQMELFDQELAEATGINGVRYILRRNPVRAAEVRASREDKLRALREFAAGQNRYLAEHALAIEKVALRKCGEKCASLKLKKFVSVSACGRVISVAVDDGALAEVSKLDGCYVLKTDLSAEVAGKEVVHGRYKDLALVERAFRVCKTGQLEVRPVHVRLASRTRGHVFVVMLAYRIVQELATRWAAAGSTRKQDNRSRCNGKTSGCGGNKPHIGNPGPGLEVTVAEGIEELKGLCGVRVKVGDGVVLNRIPKPRNLTRRLLDAAGVRLPEVLPCSSAKVATRKKIANRRKTR